VVSVSTFPALIDTFPQFRDDSFFVAEDEIVVVDHSRRIVDAIPVGPRARFSQGGSNVGSQSGSNVESRGGANLGSSFNNLSQTEIREVQQVLIDRGLLKGEATGVLDSQTREALITFQRQQGVQASGNIDARTVSALGLSNKIGQGGAGGASTTGQSPSGGQGGQTSPSNQPTTGQGQTAPQQPANQNMGGQGAAQPNAQTPQQNRSTTGQGPSGMQPPAQNQPQNQPNNQPMNNQGNASPPAQAPQNQHRSNR